MIFVTGGLGFIGSNYILNSLNKAKDFVCLDGMYLSSSNESLAFLKKKSDFLFYKGDICDDLILEKIFKLHQPSYVINFAAQSHVDNSINNPRDTINSNYLGTFKLLEATRNYLFKSSDDLKKKFRFIQISTDEVYGSLSKTDVSSSENHPSLSSSPYSASKSASEQLCYSYWKTFNVPVIITRSCNNYGPRQDTEKLIPKIITSYLRNKKIKIYGDGSNIRQWIHVNDHCKAIDILIDSGDIGAIYNIGSDEEFTNIEIVKHIHSLLANNNSLKKIKLSDFIEYVDDRKGHDFRYSLDSSKLTRDTAWRAEYSIKSGLKETVEWYIRKNIDEG